MNIIYGLYQPDEGEIIFKGKPIAFAGPQDALKKGIGMVHQHFMLIPVMTVTENIILGSEPGNFIYNKSEAERQIKEIIDRYQFDIDPSALVKDLSVGAQQRVEILKAFYRDVDLLILDEPTAVLTPQETEQMFKIINKLKEEGMTVIFISHKLEEVLYISDRITVMRQGEVQATVDTRETNEQELANLMVGREVVLQVSKAPQKAGEDKFGVENLSYTDDNKVEKVKKVSFSIKSGEIFGLAGIDGNGQTELVECLAGLLKPDEGIIYLDKNDITQMGAREKHLMGISYIPQDRQKDGLVLDFNLAENIVLKSYQDEPYSTRGMLNYKKIFAHAREKIDKFDVNPRDAENKAKNLSGGNQQKVILAREVGASPEVLIAVQPTRGLDVGAIEFIHQQLLQLRDEGKAILLVSLELDEIMSLSDRVGVIYSGELMGILADTELDREKIGLMMLGQRDNSSELEQVKNQ
ncbi:MAG: ABC transporter ATP-binding protein, partial [Halanaerobium sp.]|nr:ABC transporter ATP-binding protein [Halanaerobium sp.]